MNALKLHPPGFAKTGSEILALFDIVIEVVPHLVPVFIAGCRRPADVFRNLHERTVYVAVRIFRATAKIVQANIELVELIYGLLNSLLADWAYVCDRRQHQ